MRLLRSAIVAVSSSEVWPDFSIEHDGATVSYFPFGGDPSAALLMSATVPPEERPELDSDGFVEVPQSPRRRGEAGLQVMANLLSAATGSRRALWSPSMPVLFLGETSEEIAWLHAQAGLADVDRILSQPVFTVRLEKTHVRSLSGDRADGVALPESRSPVSR